jgi:hypothetical protein
MGNGARRVSVCTRTGTSLTCYGVRSRRLSGDVWLRGVCPYATMILAGCHQDCDRLPRSRRGKLARGAVSGGNMGFGGGSPIRWGRIAMLQRPSDVLTELRGLRVTDDNR